MENEFFDGDLSTVFQTEEGGQVVEVGDVLAGNEIQLGEMEQEIQDQELITTETITDDQLNFLHHQHAPQPISNQPDVEISLEDHLKSNERLDRSSPDLWPQNMPTAAQQVFIKNNIKGSHLDNVGSWAQGLDPEDINLLHQFGSLTSSSLVEEVKKLQNIAYQLGLEEAKELTRGRLLNVFLTNNPQHNT